MRIRLLPAFLGFLIFGDSTFANGARSSLAPADWSGIRDAYEAGRLVMVKQRSGDFAARNPGQSWLTRFDGRGFRVEPDHGGWQWGLALRAYGGVDGRGFALKKAAAVQTEANRLVSRWDDNLAEWFVNGRDGLQQGWTFTKNPAHSKNRPLRLELAVTGSLTARIHSDGTRVTFADSAGTAIVTYGGLQAWDADGRNLPARFAALANPVPGATGDFAITVDARNARFPVTIDPIAQQVYVKASNTGAGDYFGTAVAISGDTVVVGAPGEDGNGLNATPGASDGTNGDPTSNSQSGAGAAYVFVRSGGGWVQQAYLKGVVAPFVSPADNEYFGGSVAISGDTIVVGADGKGGYKGAAFVFTRANGSWNAAPVRLLTAASPATNDFFGESVGVSGDTIVVGQSGGGTGKAHVFVRSGTSWNLQTTLTASNAGAGDNFGDSIAISGDTIVVGANLEDSNETGTGGNGANNDALSSGAAYVFVRSGGGWSQQAYLKASNAEGSDLFGGAVAISGNTVVVGATSESSGAAGVNGNQSNNGTSTSGAAYVFVRAGASWTQQAYLKASNPGVFDQFGMSVAISGDMAIIGAPGESSIATGINGNQGDNTSANSGAIYVFARNGSAWSQQAYLKASNSGAQDQFGGAVAISGGMMIVGARAEDSNRTGVNGTQTDNTATDSGAAYLFAQLLPPSPPTVRLSGKKTRRTGAAHLLIKGTAADVNADLTRVEVKVGRMKWKKAAGRERWRFVARGLKHGRTTVQIRARDAAGHLSRPVKLAIRRR